MCPSVHVYVRAWVRVCVSACAWSARAHSLLGSAPISTKALGSFGHMRVLRCSGNVPRCKCRGCCHRCNGSRCTRHHLADEVRAVEEEHRYDVHEDDCTRGSRVHRTLCEMCVCACIASADACAAEAVHHVEPIPPVRSETNKPATRHHAAAQW